MAKVGEDNCDSDLIFSSDPFQQWAKIENIGIKIAVNACSVHTEYVSEGHKTLSFGCVTEDTSY